MDIKETGILSGPVGDHWYYRSKARAMLILLGRKPPQAVLDIGAGSGFFSRYLLTESDAQRALCIDVGYHCDSDDLEAGKPISFRRAVGSSDADLVILMDVLEHVEDDVGLLSEYVRKVRPGTRFLLSAPAFRFLWSSHDVFLGHRRRYTISQIEDLATASGLTVEHGCYYFACVLPIAAASRLAERWLSRKGGEPRSQLQEHGRAINGILSAVCRLELPLMRFNRLAGLTALCLAKRV